MNFIIEPISLGIITNHKSYWANHFYSIIQTMYYHNNLEYKLYNYDTLNSMRGTLPPNFFDSLEQYLKNWGLQYFLVNFLNYDSSASNIVTELINRLSIEYGVKFSKDLKDRKFHISGSDSKLTNTLHDRFTTLFPLELNGMKGDIQNMIKRSDICLILINPNTNEKVGIFGEVEGLKGYKLNRLSYWDNKPDFSIFSFGVRDGKNKQIYFDTLRVNNINKIQCFFESSNPIIQDFWHTLSYIKSLFIYGTHQYNLYTRNEEFDFFLDLVIKNWSNNVEILLDNIAQYIDGTDLIGKIEHKPLPIITSLQAD